MDKLRDRVAIVTGGARGIGGAIAVAFAAEDADAVIADRLDEDVAAPACFSFPSVDEIREGARRLTALVLEALDRGPAKPPPATTRGRP
jgi:NAD(P)-dependent dehydrogenase (short-subunit alcohol dehydrogenase family)